MPFLRLSRDQRGYETTFLLHAAHHGERPRVLYWYRSAPGVRVGRPALDEDAIRAIEEQHPNIEFDWAQILEVGAAMAADIDHRAERGPQRGTRPGDPDRNAERGPQRGSRGGDAERGPQRANRSGDPERARRKPTRPREQPASPGQTAEASGMPSGVASASTPMSVSESALGLGTPLGLPSAGAALGTSAGAEREPERMIQVEASDEWQDQPLDEVPPPGADVLSELVGREIAMRLRARYAGITASIDESASDSAVRAAWHARAAALNPDRWVTPAEILRGVQQADRLFDELRRELDN